jgi:hypothetical protein
MLACGLAVPTYQRAKGVWVSTGPVLDLLVAGCVYVRRPFSGRSVGFVLAAFAQGNVICNVIYYIGVWCPLGQRVRSVARGEAASVSGQAVVRPWGNPRCVFPPVQLRLAISVPRAGRLCLHPVCRAPRV